MSALRLAVMMHGKLKGEIDVESLLVWAFQTEKANIYDISGLDATAAYPEDCIVRCERVSVLGGFIQGTSPGARNFAGNTAADAELVAEAVARLRPRWRAQLVASHATAGNRPDWRPHARHHWRPRLWIDDGAGEEYGASEVVPMHERTDHLGRINWERRREWDSALRRQVWVAPPRWCRVEEMDAPTSIAADRRRYAEWAYSVADVRLALLGRLDRWTLTRDVPYPAPWQKKVA